MAGLLDLMGSPKLIGPMPIASYLVGISTLPAGLFFLLSPEAPRSPHAGSGNWWESISNWVLHSHPNPSYAALPLFGVHPDVRLLASHSLEGAGFHRRYLLTVQLLRDSDVALDGCSLVADWSFGRDFVLDQWLLHRTSKKARWEFDQQTIDLEAPAFSAAAKPFALRAVMPLVSQSDNANLKLEIPDVMIRYQEPSLTLPTSKTIVFSPPKLALECTQASDGRNRDFIVKIEPVPGQFGPIEAKVPVAAPSTLITNATFTSVFLSLLYLLYQLYKA